MSRWLKCKTDSQLVQLLTWLSQVGNLASAKMISTCWLESSETNVSTQFLLQKPGKTFVPRANSSFSLKSSPESQFSIYFARHEVGTQLYIIAQLHERVLRKPSQLWQLDHFIAQQNGRKIRNFRDINSTSVTSSKSKTNKVLSKFQAIPPNKFGRKSTQSEAA